MDLIPQSIFVKNFDGKYVFVNKSFAALYGLTTKELMQQPVNKELTIKKEKSIFLKQDQEVILTGVTKIIPELKFTGPDGKVHFFHTTKVPYILAGENEKLMLGIALDITAQKSAESERTKMIEDIIQRNNDLEQFSYIVSHNLRAPIANILGITTLIKSLQLDMTGQKLIQVLETSTKKLDTVVKDLNLILQIKHEINEEKQSVNFEQLIEDIKISIEHLISGANIEIICNFTQVGEILSFKTYLYSIFYNLILNSIKYRRTDVRTVIEVTSAKLENKIVLVFKDNGIGIDLKKNSGQIFGLYKRFHTHIDGKGMGLYMVKTQIEKLGGQIAVSSQVDEGTEFKIDFEV